MSGPLPNSICGVYLLLYYVVRHLTNHSCLQVWKRSFLPKSADSKDMISGALWIFNYRYGCHKYFRLSLPLFTLIPQAYWSLFWSHQIKSHTNECQFYRSPLQMRFFLCKICEMTTAQFWVKKLCFFVIMGQLLKKRCVQSRSTTNTGPHRWLEKNTNMPGWRTSCWLLPCHICIFSA